MNEPLGRAAWRGALAACLLSTIGTPLELIIGRGISIPTWPPIMVGSLGVVFIVALLLLRARATEFASSMVFLINNVAITAMLWITNSVYAAAMPHWAPYEANKLGTLAAAILGANLWSGIFSVLLFAVTGVVHHLVLPPELQARAPSEPWALIVYGIFGVGLSIYTVHRRKTNAALDRAQSQAQTMRELAGASMAIRDLAGTPLQTIVLAVRTLEERCPGGREQLLQIQRAVGQLSNLRLVLRRHEEAARGVVDGQSFDAAERLNARQKLG